MKRVFAALLATAAVALGLGSGSSGSRTRLSSRLRTLLNLYPLSPRLRSPHLLVRPNSGGAANQGPTEP